MSRSSIHRGLRVAAATALAIALGLTTGCGDSAQTPALLVSIGSPASDLVVSGAFIDVVVIVSAPDGQAPATGAAVALSVNGAPSDATITEPSPGHYLFSQVSLDGLETRLQATASKSTSDGVSQIRTVTRTEAPSRIVLTTPAAGYLNLAHPDCEAGVTPCKLTATATYTDATTGQYARLRATCDSYTGEVLGELAGDLTGGVVVFTGITLPDGQTCTLEPALVLPDGTRGQGDPTVVTVDRTPPAVALNEPIVEVLREADDAGGGSVLLHALSANVEGVAAGSTVYASLRRTDANGMETQIDLTATAALEEGALIARFDQTPGQRDLVEWPDGSTLVSLRVEDAAGNTSEASDTREASFDATVRMTFPDAPNPANCDDQIPCNGGRCYQDVCWSYLNAANAKGITTFSAGQDGTPNNLRICSNHRAAEDPARVCDGNPAAGWIVDSRHTRGGYDNHDLSALLPPGYQVVSAETTPWGTNWLSSLDVIEEAFGQHRRFFVDTTPPLLSDLNSPSDTLEPFGVLNADELSADGTFDFQFISSEEGQATLWLNGVPSLSFAVSAGPNTVSLPVYDGQIAVDITVVDEVGNSARTGEPGQTPPLNLWVDTARPLARFVTPGGPAVNASAPSNIIVTSDSEDAQVALFDGQEVLGTAWIQDGVAQFDDALLRPGAASFRANVTDEAMNTTSITPQEATVTIDRQAPIVTISAPAGGSLVDADDAQPGTPGFQVSVQWSSDKDGAFELRYATNCKQLPSCSESAVVATGAVTAGSQNETLVTLRPVGNPSRHVFSIVVRDTPGNRGEAVAEVSVDLSGCRAELRGLPEMGWFNASHCAGGAQTCDDATVEVEIAQVGACTQGAVVALFDGATELERGPAGAPLSVALTVNHGGLLNFEAVVLDSLDQVLGRSGAQPVGVDLKPPVASFVVRTVQGQQTPTEGSDHTTSYAQNTLFSQVASGVHVVLAVSGEGGGVERLDSLTLNIKFLPPIPLRASNLSLPLPFDGAAATEITLADLLSIDRTDGDVEARFIDEAGNATTATFRWLPRVSLPTPVAMSAPNISKWEPALAVDLARPSWPPGPGTYDVRYSRLPITPANFDAACDIRDLPLHDIPIPSPKPDIKQRVRYSGPDSRPLSHPCKLDVTVGQEPPEEAVWFVASRFVDRWNNKGELDADSAIVLTREQMGLVVEQIIFDDAQGAFGGFPVSGMTLRGAPIGDVNGDGFDDVAIGGSQAETLCVIYGGQRQLGGTIAAMNGPWHNCVNVDDPAFGGPERFRELGGHIVGFGDVNGDGYDDFGATARGQSWADGQFTGGGYLAVYFGRAGRVKLDYPNMVIAGMRAGTQSSYVGACGGGDFNGDGIGDIVVGSPEEGLVAIIPGDTDWKEWSYLRPNIHNAADQSAYKMWTITSDFSPTDRFGARCDMIPEVLPSANGEPAASDLAVLQPGENDGRLVILPGRQWTTAGTSAVSKNPSGGQMEDPRAVRLRQEISSVASGFAATFRGDTDMDGDGLYEIVTGQRRRSADQGGDGKSVTLFRGAAIAAAAGGDLRATATSADGDTWIGDHGYIVNASVNGEWDSVGLSTVSAAAPQGGGALEVVMLTTGGAAGMDVTARTALPGGATPFSVVHGVLDGRPWGGFSVGTWIINGLDLNRDGKGELWTGGNQGRITIIH